MAQSGATIPGQSGPGSNGNEGVLRIPQKLQHHWNHTIRLFSATHRTLVGGVLQSVYSTASAEWAKRDFMMMTYDIVTWSTTERREIRNVHFPSVFELTGRQRLSVKRGIRTVGQFLAAEVTNPGQNESQQMFAYCDRVDKEGDLHAWQREGRRKMANDWPEP